MNDNLDSMYYVLPESDVELLSFTELSFPELLSSSKTSSFSEVSFMELEDFWVQGHVGTSSVPFFTDGLSSL